VSNTSRCSSTIWENKSLGYYLKFYGIQISKQKEKKQFSHRESNANTQIKQSLLMWCVVYVLSSFLKRKKTKHLVSIIKTLKKINSSKPSVSPKKEKKSKCVCVCCEWQKAMQGSLSLQTEECMSLVST
jgi:hypothetical protein